jgi:hypothetical protein
LGLHCIISLGFNYCVYPIKETLGLINYIAFQVYYRNGFNNQSKSREISRVINVLPNIKRNC